MLTNSLAKEVQGGSVVEAKQFLNDNSQADEHGDRSFASSFKEDSSKDSPGEGLKEEPSGNEVEDSGVAFPFLDRATEEENQVEEFGGDNQEGNLNQKGNFGGKTEPEEEIGN